MYPQIARKQSAFSKIGGLGSFSGRLTGVLILVFLFHRIKINLDEFGFGWFITLGN